MNKTFAQIVANIQNEIQDSTTSMESLIKVYVNNRYFQVLRQINWDAIRDDYTFSTVAGTAKYVLPDDFRKPLSVRDTTNGNELAETSLQKLISDYPSSLTSAGTVERYCLTIEPVQAQPTSASVLAIVSSSSADSTQTITVRGVSSAVEVYEEVALTGTSPVSTTNSYTRVISIGKSAETSGKITITSNSAAVTVAVISPETLTPRFNLIRLHYVPSTAVTIALPYYIKPLPMNSGYDFPVIGVGDLLELGGKADALRYKRQFQKASVFEAQFAAGVADYIFDQENKPNEVTQLMPSTFDPDNLY